MPFTALSSINFDIKGPLFATSLKKLACSPTCSGHIKIFVPGHMFAAMDNFCLDFSIGNLGLEWLDASSVVDGVPRSYGCFHPKSGVGTNFAQQR